MTTALLPTMRDSMMPPKASAEKRRPVTYVPQPSAMMLASRRRGDKGRGARVGRGARGWHAKDWLAQDRVED